MSALPRSAEQYGPENDFRVVSANMPRGMGEADQHEYCVRLIATKLLRNSSCSSRANVAADEQSISELANSIAAAGIIEPIIVRSAPCGTFEVIAGERRLVAARVLKLREIPCVVRSCSRSDALLISLTENLQRSDLSAIEKAHAFKRLLNDFRLTQEEIGRRIGLSQSAIAHHLRLLLLPAEAKRKIERELPNGVFLIIKESATEPDCGAIEIPYYSRNERDWLMARLSGSHEPTRQGAGGTQKHQFTEEGGGGATVRPRRRSWVDTSAEKIVNEAGTARFRPHPGERSRAISGRDERRDCAD